MISLPVPIRRAKQKYSSIRFGKWRLSKFVRELGGKVRPSEGPHLDPDLRRSALKRKSGWRQLFGQVDAPQTHLENQRVGPGDLFLFFGWFRKTEWKGKKLIFKPGAPDRHVLFGWLQIDRIVPASYGCPHGLRWADYHPHFDFRCYDRKDNNTVYIAKRWLALPRLGRKKIPGGGDFPRFSEELCLTSMDEKRIKRSIWRLPRCFDPRGRESRLSHHEDLWRWTRESKHTYLETVRRGQEFVLDCEDYPEVIRWAANLVRRARQ